MNQTVKNILLFYAMAMCLLLVSSFGIFIINSQIGTILVSTTLFLTPIIALITVVLVLKKAEK